MSISAGAEATCDLPKFLGILSTYCMRVGDLGVRV